MNIPYQMCQFTAYEFVKARLVSVRDGGAAADRGSSPQQQQYDPVTNMVAGGVAGGCAASFTTPLDVVKTRLQTQGATNQRYSGALDAVETIYRQEGLSAFGRGMGPRVLFHVPSMAICWTTYESFKYLLQICDD
jgi:solute carrier family 25 iron transporter 28/37|eukprot:COSAG01_NODE_6816_length_3484_cov_65.178086_4_plen_135_part_00